jgi:hypothetical protein
MRDVLGMLLKPGQIIIEIEQGSHPQFNALSLDVSSSFQADIT